MYHFDSVCLIPASVLTTYFPYENSEKHHHETNTISKLATFENSWGKLIIQANFWIIRGLTASHEPEIFTQGECFPHTWSQSRAIGKNGRISRGHPYPGIIRIALPYLLT